MPDDLVTAGRLKLAVASVLTSRAASNAIGVATRHQVRNNGLLFDTSDPALRPLEGLLFWGLYESAEIRFLKRYLGAAPAVLELGGSLGITGAHMLRQLLPDSRFIVVEANAELLGPLTSNLSKHNPNSVRIDVHHAAVTDADGPVAFGVSTTSFASRLADEDGEAEAVRVVPGTTLQHLLDLFELSRFDLLSDIEGAEASFILGQEGPLKRCRRMVIELHATRYLGKRVAVSDLLKALVDVHGFRVLDQHGPVFALAHD